MEYLKPLFAVVCSFFAYCLGYNEFIEPLLWAITLDIVVGVIASFVNPKEQFNSKKMYRGICKKFLMLCMVAFSHQLDVMTNVNCISNTVTFYFIANDGLSIIENSCRCGIKVPVILERSLEQLNHEHSDLKK